MTDQIAPEFLSREELRGLTDCAQREAQREKLEELGVPFMLDGQRIIVSREHVRQRILGVRLRQPAGVRLDLVK